MQKKLIDILRHWLGNARRSDDLAAEELPGVMALARRHGVDWAVGQCLLRDADLDACSRSSLRNSVLAAAADGMKTGALMIRVEAICRELGVRAVFFKGAALTSLAYGNVAGRRFGDVDVLVESWEAGKKLEKALVEQGFVPAEQLPEKFADLERRYFKGVKMNGPDGAGVDIHWRLFHSFYLDMPADQFFTAGDSECDCGSVEVEVMGRRIRTADINENLIMLCAHHTTHYWNQLRLILDIAMLVQKFDEIDYAGLFDRARQLGAARMLALGLTLAKMVLQVQLPASAAREVKKDRIAGLLARRVYGRLIDGRMTFGKTELLLFEIVCRDSWVQRCSFIAGQLLTPSYHDLKVIWLPGWLRWGYYLIRIFRQSGVLLSAQKS